jgi:hypothetical protein
MKYSFLDGRVRAAPLDLDVPWPPIDECEIKEKFKINE